MTSLSIFVLALVFFCVLVPASAEPPTVLTLEPGGSIAYAVRQAREMRRQDPSLRVTIQLAPGIHHLSEPLRLRPEDSGLTIEGSGAVISGGITVDGWRRQGKLLVADVPSFNGRPIDFRQLWVNDRKAVRARDVADFEQMHRILSYDKEHQLLWVPLAAVKPLLKSGAPQMPGPEIVLHQMWETSVLRIKQMVVSGDSVALTFHDPEATIQFSHPWPSPMTPSTGHPSPFYITNSPQLLDQPGEWYHDVAARKLYYWPLPDEADGNFVATIPVLETLVEVAGTPEHPVRDVTFLGVCFAHTTWLRPSTHGHVPLQAGMFLTEAYKLRPSIDRPDNHKLDNQAWLGRPSAAVSISWARDIDFRSCRFDHIAATALDYVIGCQRGTVVRTDFSDIGMNAYQCGYFATDGTETHQPYQPTDTRAVCTGQQISHCLLTDVGNEDWGCVAVAAGAVASITIDHNTIHHVPYTAISLGWTWNRAHSAMRDNTVKANLIYDYARHVYDCAGVYTLGNQPGTVIEENVVRDIAAPTYVHDPNHWFYLYTDEGSSNITLRNNWTPTQKYLQNANGPGNVWQNNGPQVSADIVAAAGDTE